MSFLKKHALTTLCAIGTALSVPHAAQAKDGIEVGGDISVRAVQAERAVFEGTDVESSGVGASASADFTWKNGRTSVQFDLDATIFDYSDDTRPTRESVGAGLTLRQELSDEVEVAVEVRHSENIVTLESREADQTSVRAEVKWEDRKNRVRLRAQYREREYDDLARSTGNGWRFDAQYNRRLGSWHWIRADFRVENIDSTAVRRSYDRQIAAVRYSVPIAKNLRLRPEVEFRRWTYDERYVADDPTADRRRDTMIAPEIGLAYGRSRGLYGRLQASYEFRNSNDMRFDADAPRLDLRIGYRF
ncbi:hypothetical protein [Erythrobacter sp. HKB08]|uniref:hypothetical protein n=1 Tax=Erythrobacter sp. HKB08 TaxID=2502843 RepID=UPI0010093360|nr:hypothetical protein [Erythrobacter sp. HKB08]